MVVDVVELLPSLPLVLSPQHLAVPSTTAQVWVVPAERAVAVAWAGGVEKRVKKTAAASAIKPKAGRLSPQLKTLKHCIRTATPTHKLTVYYVCTVTYVKQKINRWFM